MKLTTIVAAGLALLVVSAGAAAAIPGQANDQADAHADTPEDPGQPDDPGADRADGNESENASADAGPPTDMPSQVPDHVVEIHDTINEWLDGDKEGNLGDMISNILGGGEDEEATETPDDVNETETPDETNDTATATPAD